MATLELTGKRPRSPRRRLGYFYVSDVVARNYWEELLPVMASVVPIQVEFRADLCAFEYLAFSHLFEEVPEGMVAPCYECILTKVPHIEEGAEATFSITFEFKRSSDPRQTPRP